MGQYAKELIESLQQAARHATGKKVRGLRVSKVDLPAESTASEVLNAFAEAKSQSNID
jgi:hypothetical protein